MGNLDTSNFCNKASIYYYDFSIGEHGGIPDDVIAHIDKCSFCMNEVNWLEKAQSVVEQEPLKTLVHLQISNMELHFSLANEPVTCSKIKAILPIMVISEMDVRVPTPVTTHIDDCSGCMEDLNTLRGFSLSAEQLVNISQCFSDNTFSDIKKCVEDQAVYEAIGRIQERPDSEVVTRFDLDVSTRSNSEKSSDVTGAAFKGKAADESLQKDTSTNGSRQVRPVNWKWLLKPLMAAAVIVVGFVLFFNSSDVTATNLEQVFDALKKVDNIKMATYYPDTQTFGQKIWVSRTLGAKLLKDDGEFALWDVKKGVKHIGKPGSTEMVTTKVESDLVEAAKKTMNVPWGLLPCNNPGNLPKGYIWQEITDTVDQEIKTYELLWTDYASDGSPIFYKRIYYIDGITQRPQKIESSTMNNLSQVYELKRITEISYPSLEQVRVTFEKYGY